MFLFRGRFIDFAILFRVNKSHIGQHLSFPKWRFSKILRDKPIYAFVLLHEQIQNNVYGITWANEQV